MILSKYSRRVEVDAADFNSPALLKKAPKAAFFRLLGSLPHAEHQKCGKILDFWQLSSVLCGLPLLNRPRDKAPLLYLQPQDELPNRCERLSLNASTVPRAPLTRKEPNSVHRANTFSRPVAGLPIGANVDHAGQHYGSRIVGRSRRLHCLPSSARRFRPEFARPRPKHGVHRDQTRKLVARRESPLLARAVLPAADSFPQS